MIGDMEHIGIILQAIAGIFDYIDNAKRRGRCLKAVGNEVPLLIILEMRHAFM